MRRLALASSLACGAVLAIASCGKDASEDAPRASEGGLDAPLATDAGPVVDADAEVPIGDPCGNRGGLEQGAPWPLRGGCPKRGGFAGVSGPVNATVRWSLAVAQGQGDSSPVIDAQRLVWFGAGNELLVASPGGVLQAGLTTGGVVTSPAVLASGATLAASADGTLYAVSRAGGTPADAGDAGDGGLPPVSITAQLALGPMKSSPVAGTDGTIYIGTTDGKLVAVAPDLASAKWSVSTNDTSGSAPAIGGDGTVYVGSSDKRLYAVSPGGTIKWSYETGGAILGSPAVGGDDAVYVGSADGKLVALSPDGTPRWTYTTGGAITGTPAVLAGVVYVGSADKKLHAVATRTGEGKWAYETLGAVATPIITREGTVFFGAADGRVYALTPGGTLFFAVNAKGAITTAPALSDDGTLYVTTSNGLVAIGP